MSATMKISVEFDVAFFQSLKPSAHLFTQLSKVLKLSKVQEVRLLCCVLID